MRVLIVIFFLFAGINAHAQGSILSALLETTPITSRAAIQQRMDGFMQELHAKKFESKSDVRFLKMVVNKSHRKFLKHYSSYAQFNRVFESGTYDCLSGTAFFSVVLDQLGYTYKIIETNYHIFLLVSTEQGEVLLETTDRIAGLKTSAKEISQTLATYKQNRLSASAGEANYYLYQTQLFREVDAFQLSGLLYFNQAVVLYNQQKWDLCANQLAKARSIYDNPRVEELSEILFRSVLLSEMEQTSKRELLEQLKPYVNRSPVVASR